VSLGFEARGLAQDLDERVVGEPRIAPRGLDGGVTQEALEQALAHAAPEGVRREAVLRALVGLDVREPGANSAAFQMSLRVWCA
jgi:hypothetical protein